MGLSITGAHTECLIEGCRAMELYQEIVRLRDLVRSVNLCAKPKGRSLDELGRDMHLIYDVTKIDAQLAK